MCLYAVAASCQSCYNLKKGVWKMKFKIQALKELENYRDSEILFLYEDYIEEQIENIMLMIEEWSINCLKCDGDMPMLYNEIISFLSLDSTELPQSHIRRGKKSQKKVKKVQGNVIYLNCEKKDE